jgi:hypothetical protein
MMKWTYMSNWLPESVPAEEAEQRTPPEQCLPMVLTLKF